MIKGNIATVTKKDSAIIADEKFFTETFALKDGLKNLFAGTVLKLGEGEKLEHLEGTGSEDPVAILLEDVEGESKDSHAQALIFGRVNRNKLTFKDGTAITNAMVEALRKNGIYATKGEK